MAPASTPGHNATKTVTLVFPSEFYKKRPAGPNARCMMVVTLEGLVSLTTSGALFDIGYFAQDSLVARGVGLELRAPHFVYCKTTLRDRPL